MAHYSGKSPSTPKGTSKPKAPRQVPVPGKKPKQTTQRYK